MVVVWCLVNTDNFCSLSSVHLGNISHFWWKSLHFYQNANISHDSCIFNFLWVLESVHFSFALPLAYRAYLMKWIVSSSLSINLSFKPTLPQNFWSDLFRPGTLMEDIKFFKLWTYLKMWWILMIFRSKFFNPKVNIPYLKMLWILMIFLLSTQLFFHMPASPEPTLPSFKRIQQEVLDWSDNVKLYLINPELLVESFWYLVEW